MSHPPSTELHEKIRIKAYLLWEKAGCPSGDGAAFWTEAEKVILRMAKLTEAKKAKAVLAQEPRKSKSRSPATVAVDPVLITETKPEKKKKKKVEKEKLAKKKSGKKKEKK